MKQSIKAIADKRHKARKKDETLDKIILSMTILIALFLIIKTY